MVYLKIFFTLISTITLLHYLSVAIINCKVRPRIKLPYKQNPKKKKKYSLIFIYKITDPFCIMGKNHASRATYLCKVDETCDDNEVNF